MSNSQGLSFNNGRTAYEPRAYEPRTTAHEPMSVVQHSIWAWSYHSDKLTTILNSVAL